MPVKPLPIAQGLYKNIDEKTLKVGNPLMQDCFVDEQGNIHRRPCLVELCDLGESRPIDGLYWWPEQALAIAVTNTKTFKITTAAGAYAQLTNDTFQALERVNFANKGTALYGANGEKLQGISTTAVTAMADADAPTTVSHPAILDRYLLANEVGSGNFHHSDVNAPTVWSANQFEAEAESDKLMALGVANLEIFLLGGRTGELWRDDGSTPFVRELQGYVQSGTLAKHSLTWCDGTWVWLDENRQVVMLEGRQVRVISLAINDYLQGFGITTDALGDFILYRGRPFYVLTFPSDEKTLAYDFLAKFWYEWGRWHPLNSEYDRWPGNCSCLAEAWGTTLIGDKTTSKIYKLDPNTHQDDGDIVRVAIRTPPIDWGTVARQKRCDRLYFKVKGKNVQAGTTYQIMMRYRDDGADSWSNERLVNFHSAGKNLIRSVQRRLGQYYTRQWEFAVTDNVEFVLMGIEEDFEVLRK